MSIKEKNHLLFVFDENGDELSLFSDILFYQHCCPKARCSLLFVAPRIHYALYFLPSLAHRAHQQAAIRRARLAQFAKGCSIAPKDCYVSTAAQQTIGALRKGKAVDGVYYLASFEAAKPWHWHKLLRGLKAWFGSAPGQLSYTI